MNQSTLDSLDVQTVTRYDRNDHELEAFLLLAVLVAGKNAKVQQEKLKDFLTGALFIDGGPVDYLRFLCEGEMDQEEPARLVREMKLFKLGQYRRLSRCFKQIVERLRDMHIRKMQVADLEDLYGVGPKTARFFLLHSQPNLRLAVLDTHILAWFREQGCKNVPKTTPGNRAKYRIWENRFLFLCDKAGKTPAEMDLEIWNQRSKNGNAYTNPKPRKSVSRTRNRSVRKSAVSV